MKGWTVFLLILFLHRKCEANLRECSKPQSPTNGNIICSSGTNHFDICIVSCNDGFEVSGPSRVMCWCRQNGKCTWKGGDTTCKANQCPSPLVGNGRVVLADTWPGGFAGIVEIGPITQESKFKLGWSLAVVFDRQLGQKVSVKSWNMEFSTSSFYAQTFTFSNSDHNGDLTERLKKDRILKLLFVVQNMTTTVPERAYIGLYNYKLGDASCLKAPIMHPLRYYTTSQSGKEKLQNSPTSSPVKRNSGKTKGTEKPKIHETTMSKPEKTPTAKTPWTTKIAAAKKPTATTATTSAVTGSTVTTQSASKGVHCIFQKQDDSYSAESVWVDRGVQSFNANAKITSHEFVPDWSMMIVFDSPIKSIQVWSVKVLDSSDDGLIWNFGPSKWDSDLHAGTKSVNFIATTAAITRRKISGQVFLCSDSFDNGDRMMMRSRRHAIFTERSLRKRRSLEESMVAKRKARSVEIPSSKRCGRGFRRGLPVRSAKQTSLKFSPNLDGTKYNYNELLHKSILFFEAQRSGKLPSDQRVLWRGDSNMKDGCDAKVDATGGWYDAGNFVKYNFPMAFSLTTLAWGAIVFKDAYQSAREMTNMINLIKWPTEYLIKCHTSKYEFIAQVGDAKFENSYWGRPEQLNKRRPTYKITASKPGSELAAEAAAALAASSIVLKNADPKLSAQAVKHARELYEFADKYRGKYHVSVPAAAPQYKSYSGFEDELIWAATWLHKATNEIKYLRAATTSYAKIGGRWSVEDRYVWDRKLVGAQLLLSEITGNDIYRDPLSKYLNNLETAATNSKGMYHLDEWAPNRYTSGASFIALVAATLTPHLPRETAYLRWAEKQMRLILGDTGKSFIVGFGKAYPKKVRHSSSSCPPFPKKCDWSTFSSSKPNHYILYGAMVGGPDEFGAFKDARSNIKGNHVACDYNAVFQSAIAGLKHFAMKDTGKTILNVRGPSPTKPSKEVHTTTIAPATSPTSGVTTTQSTLVDENTITTSWTRPKISEKKRCARRSPVGLPVRNAKQIIPKFKANNDGTKHNYNKALHLSLLFFEIQRAGRLPPNNRIPWRGDSTLKDGCDVGADVSGGWFDAGDHVKFGFPMAFSLTTLAWGGTEFRNAYVDAGEINNLIGTIKWGAEFFINAHTAKYELIGQVGNGKADHDSWGRPETMSMHRPSYKITSQKPGSELAAEAAAALAASSIFLKDYDPSFSADAIKHAEELYEFADKYRGLYHKSIRDAVKYYKSFSGYDDELIWGAAWLYKATRKQKYLRKATQHYKRIKGKYVVETRYSWDRKLCGAQAILGSLTGHADYKQPFYKMINGVMRARTTPQGMHFIDKWGSNRYAAGAAFMAAIAAKMKPPRRSAYERWARKQIDLMLGDAGRSYVVGYGKNYPKRPHHRASSCPPYPRRCDWSTFKSAAPNYYILYGALVGGPNERGRYFDRRHLYKQTEVTTDYNACFQSAVAGVKYLIMKRRKPVPTYAATKPTRKSTTLNPIQRLTPTAVKPTTPRATSKPISEKQPSCKPAKSLKCRQQVESTARRISSQTTFVYPHTTTSRVFSSAPTSATSVETSAYSRNTNESLRTGHRFNQTSVGDATTNTLFNGTTKLATLESTQESVVTYVPSTEIVEPSTISANGTVSDDSVKSK